MGRNWLVYPMDVLEYKAPKQNEWDNTFEDDIIGKIDMERWIETLTDEQRTIVELLMCGYNQTEVAAIIGKTKETVSKRVKVLRVKLKRCLNEK